MGGILVGPIHMLFGSRVGAFYMVGYWMLQTSLPLPAASFKSYTIIVIRTHITMLHDPEAVANGYATKDDLKEELKATKNDMQYMFDDFKKEMRAGFDKINIQLYRVEQVQQTKKLKYMMLLELKRCVVTDEQVELRSIVPLPIPKLRLEPGEMMIHAVLRNVRTYGETYNCKENCDQLARFCWASMVGGLDMKFVQCSTVADYDNKHQRCTTLHDARRRIDAFVRCDNPHGLLLIRFVERGTDDGHSLVLWKFESTITTFQSYLFVSKFMPYTGDKTQSIFEKLDINTEAEVCASDFGITPREGAIEKKWLVDGNRCMIYSTAL